MAQDGPKIAQDGPKMTPRWPETTPRWAKIVPKWAEMVPEWPQDPKMHERGALVNLLGIHQQKKDNQRKTKGQPKGGGGQGCNVTLTAAPPPGLEPLRGSP